MTVGFIYFTSGIVEYYDDDAISNMSNIYKACNVLCKQQDVAMLAYCIANSRSLCACRQTARSPSTHLNIVELFHKRRYTTELPISAF